jgi:hypothetical protein
VRRGVAGRDISEPAANEFDAIQQRILKSRETDLSGNPPGFRRGELADSVIAAGRCARSRTDEDPPCEMNALAKAVVEAGKKRRRMSGEPE